MTNYLIHKMGLGLNIRKQFIYIFYHIIYVRASLGVDTAKQLGKENIFLKINNSAIIRASEFIYEKYFQVEEKPTIQNTAKLTYELCENRTFNQH